MILRRKHRNSHNHDSELLLWSSVLVVLFLLTLLLILLSERVEAREWAGWCQPDSDLGWHFYCDPDEVRPKEVLPDPAPAPLAAPDPAPLSATQQLAEMRAELDELRATALLNPTHKNTEAYTRAQAQMTEMAGGFAFSWQQVLWATPELDYEARHPQANLAKKASQAELYNKRQQIMAHLNERYGLIYVGTGPCAVCKIYGPHLRAFAQRWGLTVLAVSADGTPLSGWPQATPDTGQLAQLRITPEIVPLTALFDQTSHKVTLLGVGFLAEADLVERIHRLTDTEQANAF